jgi:hypothetical protein
MTRKRIFTTLSNGCLGFRLDEERGKMRYVMRIAEFSESSTLRTHLAQRLVFGLASWAQFVRGKHVFLLPVPFRPAMVCCGREPFVATLV